MKVKGLDGREYPWSLPQPVVGDNPAKSEGHRRAKKVLKGLYPLDRLLEEVGLPGCPTRLTADFFVPLRKLLVEVQGRQHEEFVPHFHGSREGFAASRRRDNDKRKWAELNGLTLVELPDDESDEEWRERIRSAY